MTSIRTGALQVSSTSPQATAAPASREPESHPTDVAEVGSDKTVVQHAGNAGFAAASVFSGLGAVSKAARTAKMVPGLNLAVGAVETLNFFHQIHKKNHVVAAGHAGNAVGCLAAFMEDVGRYDATFLHGVPTKTATAVACLGLAGGVFGIYQGIHEVKIGHALKEKSGSTRTLRMGIADLVSGLSTVAGIMLRVSTVAPTVGTALLVAASACDLASIGVDYLGRKDDEKHNRS